MASLQARMIAFADERITEQDPTRADNFVEKWHRRLKTLLQQARVVQVESQENEDGSGTACGRDGQDVSDCPQWERNVVKEMTVDLKVQRLRREARRAQQEDDAVMRAALTPATPAKRVREPSMEHRELERDRVRVDLAGIVDAGAGGWQHA